MRMIWTNLDTRIVIIAALCAAACAIPGSLLVLKRMSMLTHAIAHAVLPGLVLAFIAAGDAHISVLVGGAFLTGIITALLVQCLIQWTNIEQGTAIGVVFTTLFAIGLILMRLLAEKAHLHADCIIEGQLTLAATEQSTYLGITLPHAAWLLATVMVINLVIIGVFWKEIIASVFDHDHAQLQGLRPQLLQHLIMIMTATTTVAAFEAVGSILVVAMMVIPAATAILLSHRLMIILILAVALGIAAAFIGHILAVILPGPLSRLVLGEPLATRVSDSSSAGMIAVVNGVILFSVIGLQYLLRRRHWSALNKPPDSPAVP